MSSRNRISIQDFIRGMPTCETIIKSLYDLNKFEFTIFWSLQVFGKTNVISLMDYVNCHDRTRINRALLSLLNESLCTRKKISEIGKRGYHYIYQTKSLNEIRKELTENINKWQKNALLNLDRLESEFESRRLSIKAP